MNVFSEKKVPANCALADALTDAFDDDVHPSRMLPELIRIMAIYASPRFNVPLNDINISIGQHVDARDTL
jgi:hypothetical protein